MHAAVAVLAVVPPSMSLSDLEDQYNPSNTSSVILIVEKVMRDLDANGHSTIVEMQALSSMSKEVHLEAC